MNLWPDPKSLAVPNSIVLLLANMVRGVCKQWRHHDDVIKWKHFPRYWPSVRGIHRSPVNSPHKGQWRGALMFSFIFAWMNDWVNNREAGDLRRHRPHYDVIVMMAWNNLSYFWTFVRGIHWTLVVLPNKWLFDVLLLLPWTNCWTSSRWMSITKGQ